MHNVSFFGLLGLILITLKLTGYITWSWWAVTAPLWGIWLLSLIVVAAFAVFLFFLVGKQ